MKIPRTEINVFVAALFLLVAVISLFIAIAMEDKNLAIIGLTALSASLSIRLSFYE